MSEIITESGMDFLADGVFRIEKSSLYSELGEGIKSVEFIRVKDGALLFLESKETFPNPKSAAKGNLKRFNTQSEDICDKFIHSLNLFSSVRVNVADYKLPTDFILPDIVALALVLVVKNHDNKGCKEIKTKLIELMPTYLLEIWKPSIYVINHGTAIRRNLAIG